MISLSSYTMVASLLALLRFTRADYSPVLILGVTLDAKPRPVFPPMTENTFQTIVNKMNINHTLVVFEEESMKTNILACDKGKPDDCFDDIPFIKNYTYYACVENPLEAVTRTGTTTKILEIDEQNHVKFDCENSLTNQVLIIKAKENALKTNQLKDRGITIRKLKSDMTYCVLSPHFFFINRKENIDEDCKLEGPETELPVEEETFIIRVKTIATIVVDNLTMVDVATQANRLYKKIDEGPKNLTLNIRRKPGFIDIKSIIYDDKQYSEPSTKWRKESSFAISGVSFRTASFLLRINSFQLGARDQNPSPSHDEENVFVTPGILSGLLISFLLASIAFLGISMIMDIKTNVRFMDTSAEQYFANNYWE